MPKKIFFYLIMFGFVFLVLEAFGYLAYRLFDADDFYDHRAGVLERLDEDTLSVSSRVPWTALPEGQRLAHQTCLSTQDLRQ
jgi:hypothetical protein